MPVHIFTQPLVAIVILLWLFWAAGAIYSQRLTNAFMRVMSERFPAYYASIIRPGGFPGSLMRSTRIAAYTQNLTLKGLPADLPDDDEVRYLALRISWFGRRMLALFVVYMALIVGAGIWFT